MIHTGNKGFTLIELAVVLTILSLILGLSLSLGGKQLEISKINTTKEKLDKIEEALKLYVDAHGYLPCPASNTVAIGSPEFGVDSTEDPVLDDAGAPMDSCGSAAKIGVWWSGTGLGERAGAVPVRALGLPDSYAWDAWNNRFMYEVPVLLARRDDTSANAGAGAQWFYQNNPGLIEIRNAEAGAGVELTSNNPAVGIGERAAYVLISYGKDRFGGNDARTGNLVNNCASQPAQKRFENCNITGNANSNSLTYTDTGLNDSTDTTAYFDDIVRWKTKRQISGVAAATSTRPIYYGATYVKLGGTDLPVGAANVNIDLSLISSGGAAWGGGNPIVIPNDKNPTKARISASYAGMLKAGWQGEGSSDKWAIVCEVAKNGGGIIFAPTVMLNPENDGSDGSVNAHQVALPDTVIDVVGGDQIVFRCRDNYDPGNPGWAADVTFNIEIIACDSDCLYRNP